MCLAHGKTEGNPIMDLVVDQKETQVESYAEIDVSHEQEAYINYLKFLEILSFLFEHISEADYDEVNKSPVNQSARGLSEISRTVMPAFALMQLIYIAGQLYLGSLDIV